MARLEITQELVIKFWTFLCIFQIRSRLSDLKQESGQLQQVWLNQKQHLDQMLQLQFFLRDAKNIDAMSGAHEVS